MVRLGAARPAFSAETKIERGSRARRPTSRDLGGVRALIGLVSLDLAPRQHGQVFAERILVFS